MIYKGFILELWYSIELLLWSLKKMKYGFPSKHRLQRKQQHGGWKDAQGNGKVFKNNVF